MGAINLSDPSIKQAWDTITDNNAAKNWALFELEERTDKVKVTGVGEGGMGELKTNLDSSLIQFGAFRVIGGQNGEASMKRSKFVWFISIGGNVSSLKKARISVQKPEIAKFFQSAQIGMEITSPDQLNKKDIAKKLITSAGAFRPDFYEFAPGDTIPIADIA